MAQGVYIGVNGQSKQVNKIYIGDTNGIAREVKKIYLGDTNGLAREAYSATPPVTMKTFSEATEEEIAEMVQAADAGLIDLYEDCGWRVGQERIISLGAIASSGTYDGVTWSVGEAQSAQTITLVLMHKGSYQLVTPVKAKGGATRNTCSFIVGMKDCMLNAGRMTNTTSSDYKAWSVCARRKWCNGGFRSALPTNIRSCFKQFNCISGSTGGTGATIETTQDYFTLAAEKEVLGSPSNSIVSEANALTQFTWYTTSTNRKKYLNGSSYSYWTRSHSSSTGAKYCIIGTNGSQSVSSSSTSNDGISLFGCV